MLLYQLLQEYQDYNLDLSPKTQTWYVQKLTIFVEWCAQEQIPPEKINNVCIGRFLECMRQRTNPRNGLPITTHTIHGYAQVIRSFVNFCKYESSLAEFLSGKLPKKVKMPRVEQKIVEAFTEDQTKRLFKACEKECTQALVMRDKAILAVLIDTGIRAGELVGLTLDHVHLRPQDPHIRVFGKGIKWREVGLGDEARTILRQYISRYRRPRYEDTHVFLSRYNEPLTTNGLYQIIDRLGEWGRVRGVRCATHTLRHTYAVRYLQAGGSIYDLSILMGHTSVRVTEVYLKTYRARDARKHSISVLDLQTRDKKNQAV